MLGPDRRRLGDTAGDLAAPRHGLCDRGVRLPRVLTHASDVGLDIFVPARSITTSNAPFARTGSSLTDGPIEAAVY